MCHKLLQIVICKKYGDNQVHKYMYIKYHIYYSLEN